MVPQAGTVGEWPDGLYEAELRVAAFQNGYFTALANRVGRRTVDDVRGRVVRLRSVRACHRARAGGAEAIVYADLDLAQLAVAATRGSCSSGTGGRI